MKGSMEVLCPKCSNTCLANFVNVGTCLAQMEPYRCQVCHWVQDCPNVKSCPGDKCRSFHHCAHVLKNKPTDPLEQLKERMSMVLFKRSRLGSIKHDICVSCGDSAEKFRDKLSAKEYQISGFCQRCQDKVFQQKRKTVKKGGEYDEW